MITFLFKKFSYAAEILILSDAIDFLTKSLRGNAVLSAHSAAGLQYWNG